MFKYKTFSVLLLLGNIVHATQGVPPPPPPAPAVAADTVSAAIAADAAVAAIGAAAPDVAEETSGMGDNISTQ